MKLWILMFAISCSAQVESFTNGRTFRLEFDYPYNYGQMVFRAHSSTNIGQTMDQWSATEITVTNGAGLTNGLITLSTTDRFPAYLPMTFFAVSASNEWGIIFSEPVTTAPPVMGRSLRLK